MRIFRNKESFPYRFLRLFIQSDVPAASAEMAYFLVFAFFPLLMVIHASLSMVIQGFDLEQTFFYSLLPNVIEELLDTYIEHISENSNISFLVLGIILTVYTLSKFMKSTKRTVRRIYHSHSYAFPLAEWGISIVLSVLIIVAFYVSLFLLILGGQILGFIEQNFHMFNIIKIKSVSRFIFTAVIIYTVVTLVYLWIPNIHQRLRDVFPGTLFTSVVWVLVSGVFSFYMNNFSNYSIIHGSIGAFIMLLLWIYISCMILLIGAVINAILHSKKSSVCTLVSEQDT